MGKSTFPRLFHVDLGFLFRRRVRDVVVMVTQGGFHMEYDSHPCPLCFVPNNFNMTLYLQLLGSVS